MHKPTFIAGLAVGYLLGTRAGRKRYEQIRKASHAIVQAPAVQSAARAATHAAGSATHTAAHALAEKIGHRPHRAGDHPAHSTEAAVSGLADLATIRA